MSVAVIEPECMLIAMRAGAIVVCGALALVSTGCKKKDVALKDGEVAPAASCTTDAECAVAFVPDCCNCCQGSGAIGVAKKGPTYHRDCSKLECKRCFGSSPDDDCDPVSPETFKAVCTAGKCEAKSDASPIVLRPEDPAPPPPTCASDADCALADVTECGACCRGVEIAAVPKGKRYKRDCEGTHVKVCAGPKECSKVPGLAGHVAACVAGKCQAKTK